jgi:hypothetical protein
LTFNGINTPEFIYCCFFLPIGEVQEIYNHREGSIFKEVKFHGIVTGNLHLDHAKKYFNSVPDNDGMSGEFVHTVFKIRITREKKAPKMVNVLDICEDDQNQPKTCMILKNCVTFTENERQVLLCQPQVRLDIYQFVERKENIVKYGTEPCHIF